MSITEELTGIVGHSFEAISLDPSLGLVRLADRPDLAQFQCNGALAAAKAAKQNPRVIAEKIAERLRENNVFQEVTIAGPGFINLTLAEEAIGQRVQHLSADELLGAWRTDTPEKQVIDFGGPNVAKPLHVGHLRAAIIGECLKRLMGKVGHEVIGDVHLGDWGLQMGQLISEFELRFPESPFLADGDGPFPDDAPLTMEDLSEMYPAASAACKADAERMALAKRATKALQEGHSGYRALWRHMVDASISALKADYDALNVHFDLWKGEADADALIPGVTEDLTAKGILEESDGAIIISVAREDDNKTVPPIIYTNSEGAVGYHTTDIATIVDRLESLNPDRILYVVDARQRLHFEQLFRAVSRADYIAEEKLEHLWFGTMNGKDGKPFKTRAGGVLKLRDLIDQADEKALERLQQGGFADGISPEELMQVARQVGVAALKFADLSNPRTTDYVFDIDKFMSFEGKTGPYLLYARVRIRSVIERAGGLIPNAAIRIDQPAERDLALALLNFSDAVRNAVTKRMPHHICDHSFSLAQAFSKFYAACRIKDENDDAVRASRLMLADLTGRQLDVCLDILGISAPERM